MESALLSAGVSALSFFSIYKSLNSHSYPLIAHLNRRFSTARQIPVSLLHLSQRSVQGPLVRGSGPVDLLRDQGGFFARYSSSFASEGGGIDGGTGGGSGGGDGRAEGGEANPSDLAAGPADSVGSCSEVIILDVGGMTCGGCAASVKRILESQPQVSSASVNLTTETALVWPVSEAKTIPNWQKDIGETLAKHLTSCGFQSNLKDLGANGGHNKS